MLNSSGYTVLLVEDDPNHALLIQLAFDQGDRDARVRIARTAEEAIVFLEDATEAPERLPDVIVLDIYMPGMGGLGFLEWWSDWHAASPDIPIVVLTSSDDPTLASRCFALGAREFRQKPSDFSKVVVLVRNVLKRWRPQRRPRRTNGA